MLTLDQIAAAPSRAAELSPDGRQRLLLQCSAVLVALGSTVEHESGDRQLDSAEAAGLLGWSVTTLQERARAGKLSFAKQQGRRWYYSHNGLQRYMAR